MPSSPDQPGTQSSAARIGRWIIPAIPFGWTWIPDFGIQKAGENTIPSNVYLKEDELLAGNQLSPYIQTQITLMKRTFLDPAIAGPAPLQFPNADEAGMLMLKHQPMNPGSPERAGFAPWGGNQVTVIQVQHYIKSGNWIGIATLTTTEAELLKVRPDFEQFMKLLRIEPSA